MAMMRTPLRDRLIGALGAAGVVALLLYALLIGLTVGFQRHPERAVTLLDLAAPPKPLGERDVERRPRKAAAHAAAPRALRSKPAEIVAPPPPVLPVPTPVIAARVAGPGAAAAAGASDLPGPGQGAGGQGNGTGGGGDGGGGDDDEPPRLIRGRLEFADMPRALREAGVNGTVVVRYHVEIDGSVRDCLATGSSGNADLDRLTCRLIEERFRFEPSRRPDGRPVRSTIEESHSWIVERAGTMRLPD